MRRREFLFGVGGGAAGALMPVRLPAMWGGMSPQRGVLVCVASNADAGIREAAESIAHAAGHPVLQAMGATPTVSDTRGMIGGDPHRLAYNHLILVGLPSDPLIAAAWQREAKPAEGGMYIFGFGHLKGDIGYIESDRNPFLHAQTIAITPFETQTITITGSSTAGVQLAAETFVKRSLVNGVVAREGWSRPGASLLERDPLGANFEVPAIAPERIGDAVRLAYTQASEDEYRGVLADTGILPAEIWRVKYFEKGNWDGEGAEASFDNYAAGLHRRAYGNTLWTARFSSASEAADCATKIAAAAHLKKSGSEWKGNQSPYANATYPGDAKVPGTITLAQHEAWVTMFTQQIRWVPGTPAGTVKVG